MRHQHVSLPTQVSEGGEAVVPDFTDGGRPTPVSGLLSLWKRESRRRVSSGTGEGCKGCSEGGV